MPELRVSPPSARHRLTSSSLQLPGWLRATGIQPPCPPTPQPEFQLQQAASPPPSPQPLGGLGWDGGLTVVAAGLCHPRTAAGGGRRPRLPAAPSEAIMKTLCLEVFTPVLGASIQAAPKQGACVAAGQTRPARWPPSSVFLALSSPLPLLLSHIPLLRPEPLKTLFSQLTAVLGTHGKGRGVTPSPTAPGRGLAEKIHPQMSKCKLPSPVLQGEPRAGANAL